MKIVMLEGSPNKNGSSNLLADCFRQGAEEVGHTIEIIDAQISIPAPAASTAVTRAPVCRRTMWNNFVRRSCMRI